MTMAKTKAEKLWLMKDKGSQYLIARTIQKINLSRVDHSLMFLPHNSNLRADLN